MDTVIVLFTRDLRLRDNPALDLACRSACRVVPLFVADEGLGFAVPNRLRFLHQCLADLRGGLRRLGGDLVVRTGDPVGQTLRLAGQVHADGVVIAGDVSAYAQRRWRLLSAECRQHRLALRGVDSLTVVAPGALRPAAADHYRVFTPYWNAWTAHPWRGEAPTPRIITMPGEIDPGVLPEPPYVPADLPTGGESAARRRLGRFLRDRLDRYADHHDDLAADATSRLSADLHFGCLSPLEVAVRARRAGGTGGEAFVRQLCWRDFHAQVCAAFPDLPHRDYRPRPVDWRDARQALDAWRAGRTGYPVIDAGIRQLAAEGFLPNRARLLVAAMLTRYLQVHWTVGAEHFFELLVDGDIANNAGNWQWVAGTGNDTCPHRRFNLIRQAHRFDPDGAYVRRHIPELAGIDGPAVHQPWQLDRQPPGYPTPILDPGT